jgi:hypothetical protein
MKKCSYCLEEMEDEEKPSYKSPDEVIMHGNNSFCSNSCMNYFYREYPNEKLKDNKINKKEEGCVNFFVFCFKLCFYLFIIWLFFQMACNT